MKTRDSSDGAGTRIIIVGGSVVVLPATLDHPYPTPVRAYITIINGVSTRAGYIYTRVSSPIVLGVHYLCGHLAGRLCILLCVLQQLGGLLRRLIRRLLRLVVVPPQHLRRGAISEYCKSCRIIISLHLTGRLVPITARRCTQHPSCRVIYTRRICTVGERNTRVWDIADEVYDPCSRGCPTRDPSRSPVVIGCNPWNMLSSPLRLVCSRGDTSRSAWGNSQTTDATQGQGIPP
eukprot:3298052-Pyramimonas_sp.AAC.1